MPGWARTPDERRRNAAQYSDPEYQKNRKLALRRANGRCEQCGASRGRLQVDHMTNLAEGGTHALSNLQVLCSGPGSCHAKKSAAEGARASRGGRGKKPPANPAPLSRTQW